MTKDIDLIYTKALTLSYRFDDKFVELAALLRQLKESDPSAFKNFLVQAGLGRRRSYYLIDVAEAFGDIAMAQQERLNRIGWTKLQILARNVTPKNREKLLRLAEGHTVEDLKALMQGQEPLEGRRTVLLYFSAKQYEKFAKAIAKNGAIRSGEGYANKEEALIRALKRK
jgi:hypothetical protein